MNDLINVDDGDLTLITDGKLDIRISPIFWWSPIILEVNFPSLQHKLVKWIYKFFMNSYLFIY